MARVADIMAIVEEIAPASLAESYDNTGLLAGHPDWEVRRVLTALDLTEAVVEEAVQAGAQLIVTHHPIFFRGRSHIREDDTEGAAVCALIRSRLALIAAHTNFDSASPGVNDALAGELGLEEVQAFDHGMRMGTLPRDMTPAELKASVEDRLRATVRLFAPHGRPIRRVAVLGGAGGDFYRQAIEIGAECFITGEVKHHEAIAACGQGLCLLEAGHLETERVAIKLLRSRLQERADALQYHISVIESRRGALWAAD